MLILSLMTRYSFLSILYKSIPMVLLSPTIQTSTFSPPPPPPPTTIPIIQQDSKQMQIQSQIIRRKITSILQKDVTLAGPLLRLAFHDAATREDEGGDAATTKESTHGSASFTGGSNGSIQYELSWSENRALSRPLQIVQSLYKEQQKTMVMRRPSFSFSLSSLQKRSDTDDDADEYKMSLADVIALAGAQAVEVAGGPSIPIHLGRLDVIPLHPTTQDTLQKREKGRDVITSKETTTIPITTEADDATAADPYYRRTILSNNETKRSIVTTTLPSAGLDSDGLRLYFTSLGLSESELVAICGAHDLGRHVTLLNMTKSCLKILTRDCLENAPVSIPFVSKDPDTFSNEYYKALLRWYDRNVTLGEVAFIPTDVNLVVDEGLRVYVEKYAKDEGLFFREFTSAYQKLVDATATSIGAY
mmetsp:Transcript_55373/g.82384  ORF Transcript_55373/g.82384 Transcript_55373/m.82384 type:complete len:418 (-) Transcript_55373:271-1524(-)